MQWADAHHLPEDPAEVSRRGKAGLLGHRADVQVGGLQQMLRGLDAAAVDVVHDGLPRHPPEQTAEVVGRQIEPRRHIGEGEFLLIVRGEVGADLLHGLVPGAGGLPLGFALLVHIMQQQRKVDDAGAVRFPGGAPHQVQQGAQAAGPLHRAVQGRLCSRLKQRHEIPLHQVLEHRENARREPTADELRGNVARLLQQAPAGAQQQHTARVHQQALTAPHQRKAAAGHQNDPADLLLLSQLILAGLEPQRLCRYLAAPFFPFRFHPHTPFNSFFSSVYHARHLWATHKSFNIQGGILFMKLSLIRSMTRTAAYVTEEEQQELCQIGYLALCRSAVGFEEGRSFQPYAKTIIRHAIFDYWRKIARDRSMLCSLDEASSEDEHLHYRDLFSYEDTQTTHPEKDTNQTLLLEHLTQLGTGQSSTIQKGIVALYLQQQGYTSFDLAKHYQVPANRVRAWQSKARKLLQQDDALYALLT